METLQNYLGTRLPRKLTTSQLLRSLLTIYLLVFAGAVVIDILVRPQTRTIDLLIHAASIGLIYAMGFAIAASTFLLLGMLTKGLRVWHLWCISLIGFTLGYYLLPWDGILDWLPGLSAVQHSDPLGFTQLLPVSFLITYLFIQPFFSSSLRSELAKLRELNTLLSKHQAGNKRTSGQLIHFAAGRTEFTLAADNIRHIHVDDHYCYIHSIEDGKLVKRNIAMTLRDLMNMLPARFVQVHRSHVVNLGHVSGIRRTGRNIRVLIQGDSEVPVSRHRLEEVLPILRQHVSGPLPDSVLTKNKDPRNEGL